MRFHLVLKSFVRFKNSAFRQKFSTLDSLNLNKGFELQNMTKNIFQRLEDYYDNYKATSEIVYSEETFNNKEIDVNRLQKCLNDLTPYNNLYERMKGIIFSLNDLYEMEQEKNDVDTNSFILEEIETHKAELLELEEEALNLLIPDDHNNDCKSIILEIRPGVGGSESGLFAEEIFNMYQTYSITQGWNFTTTQVSKDAHTTRGVKLIIAHIKGFDTYKKLKCESGIHKVIRVPETESKGRLHSSTISVVVMPEKEIVLNFFNIEIRIE